MKEYKVEVLNFYSKLTWDKDHIAKSSEIEIQQKLNEYAQKGFRLISTSSAGFESAIYIYLYFEKEF